MKKPKVISYKNGVIALKVDGRLCSYFVDRPQPLSAADATMLRNTMDMKFLGAMTSAMYINRGFLRNLVYKLRGLGGAVLTYVVHADGSVFETFARQEHGLKMSEVIANYIEKVGVEIDVGEAKALVIHRSVVDKIRRGEIL